MFIEDFDPSAALASTSCPGCHALGLVEINSDIYDTTPHAQRYLPKNHIDPSVPAMCRACGLVMEWPRCNEQPKAS